MPDDIQQYPVEDFNLVSLYIMANRVDWNNIHWHIDYNDVRYKRRLLRKQLSKECSPSITNVSPAAGSLNKLKSVQSKKIKGNDEAVVACPNVGTDFKPIRVDLGGERNDEDSGVEMFEEGFTEGGKSLVCEVEDGACGDVSLKKLEIVQDGEFLCNDVDPDSEMFKEGFTEGGKSLVCRVEDSSCGDVSLKKLEIVVQDREFLCNDFDPDSEMFDEGLREGGKSLVCGVEDSSCGDVGLKKLEIVQDREFLCIDVDPDSEVFKEGLREGGKSLVCRVEDSSCADVILKKLEIVQDGKFLCDDVNPDSEVFKEGLRESGKSLVCEVEDGACGDVSLKKLEIVQDGEFLCNDVDPDSEMFKEGFTEGGKSLVCKVDDSGCGDVTLKKLEIVQDGEFLCNDVDPDSEMFKEGSTEGGKSLVCKVDDSGCGDVTLKKLEIVQDGEFLCYDVDPDSEMFKEGLREGGKFLVCKVNDSGCGDVSLKLETVQDQEFLCNDVDPDSEMFKEGFTEGRKSLVCKVDDSGCGDVSLKKLEIVQDRGFLCNDVDPELESFKEGLREGKKSLLCEVGDSASDDVCLKKLENVQVQKFLCYDLFPELEMFKEGFREGGKSLVCQVEDSASDDVTGEDAVDPDFKMFKEDSKEEKHLFASSAVGMKKLGNVQDRDLRKDELRVNYRDNDVKFGAKRTTVDPDYKKFLEGLKVDGQSFALKVKKNDRSLSFLKYEKDVLHKEYQRKLKGDNVKNVPGKQKGDTANYLKNNTRKEKMDKVVPRREGFSWNSNRSPVAKRSSVVKRRDNMEIISIGKPIEMEEVIISKNNRPSTTIRNKRQRPLNLDDGHNIKHLRKSKKRYEKVERRPCFTRIDHVSNLMDIAGKSKRHYRRTSPRSEQRDLMVQQGKEIENSRFSSGIGNLDVMVKEEKFDDRTIAVVKKRRQMVQGRDSANDSNMRRYKCTKKFGKHAEVKDVNANSLNYDEEDNEHSSDLEILDTDNQENLRKFEVMKVFNASVIEDYPLRRESPSDYENPEFREELMDILRRPFDLEEYRSLMQKAKYRHLMGGPEFSDGLKGKEVSNTYGKSPLDYHPDVQKRLRHCRKISRRLNILRGFIYWYERACQDGAFKPWLDKSCAAVTPSLR